MTEYLTVSQMVACEQRSDKTGVSLARLMDNAAEGLFKMTLKAADKVSRKNSKTISGILIIAGKGNNGGDGLVCARLLQSAGLPVSVFLAQGQPATSLSLAAYEKLDKTLLTDDLQAALDGCDILIDCIFGTGFKGSIRQSALPLFNSINSCAAFKIACDIPSGCNADTGECDPHSVNADMTVTFHRPKVGMALKPAKALCGELYVCDIGISDSCKEDKYSFLLPTEQEIVSLLPRRPVNGHKGTFGRLLCICGSEQYIGAAALSTTAALRTGVGLVQLASCEKAVSVIAASTPECTYLPLKADSSGTIDKNELDKILPALSKADAVLIGCGLGVSESTKAIVYEVIKNAACPVVCDADALNCIGSSTDVLLSAKAPLILTPHIGELARLCGKNADETLSDRPAIARELAKKTGALVVSKSASTLVTSQDRSLILSYGNTALSKGGSGDMLAGMIASFAAQGVSCESAAALGCYLLGKTAQTLSTKYSERSVIARDILDSLPEVLYNAEHLS
ncbi:MAG: NAD(P)H-hydrate dehydratase [Ruminococcus sp.]|nr:NAD(P)H-hydrate dehydratase [Ruminococcus sp.]